jgi:ABC-2 type transport system permease protein
VARLLVRLKLRLLANTLQRGGAPAVGLVLSALFALGAGAWGFWLLSTVETPEFWADVVVLVYAAIFTGWLLLPAMTFSADETLDPRRFALLPVTPRRLVGGLLVTGGVGVGPLGTLVAASGVVLGTWRLTGSAGAAAFAAVAALLLLAVSVAWSRALLTVASRLLASRRGRDLVAVLGAVLAVMVWLLFTTAEDLIVPGDVAAEEAADLSGPAGVARWLPGGLVGAVIADAALGRPLAAGVALAGAIAWLLAGTGAWVAALHWTRGKATASGGPPPRRSELYPVGLRWLPRGRTTAVAARFLRGLVRDARVRTQALLHLVLVLPVLALAVGGGALQAPWSPMLAVLVVVPFGLLAANQVGLDGPALWLHEVSGARPVADLLGRCLGLALAALPVATLIAAGFAALNGAWAHLPAALLAVVGALAVVLGVATVSAVLLPAPVAEEPDNIFGSSEAGQGCLGTSLMLVTLVVQMLLLSPLLVGLRVVDGAAARTVVSLVGLGYGAAVLAATLAVAARLLRTRGPELLAAVDPRRA